MDQEGMLLALTVGQFGFPGLGGLGGRQNGPFLFQRGGGGFGGLGGGGGFGGGLGGFNFQQPTTTPEPPTTTQDQKKVASMLVEVISKNFEYHLTHDKNQTGNAPPPKKLSRIDAIKEAVFKHNLMQ